MRRSFLPMLLVAGAVAMEAPRPDSVALRRVHGESLSNNVDVELQTQDAGLKCFGDTLVDPSTLAGLSCRGGAWMIPAGYNPFGYKITELGESFLEFEGSLDCDVGRFLASLKSRKKIAALKSQWLEIVRVSKSAQTMRIYRTLDDLIAFCIKARLLD